MKWCTENANHLYTENTSRWCSAKLPCGACGAAREVLTCKNIEYTPIDKCYTCKYRFICLTGGGLIRVDAYNKEVIVYYGNTRETWNE